MLRYKHILLATILVILFIVLFACDNKTPYNEYSKAYNNVEKHLTDKRTVIKQLKIDTIKVDKTLTSSGEGFWRMNNKLFFFFDKILGTVDVYDKKGMFQRRALGIGKGPGEVIEEIGTVCSFDNDWLIAHIYQLCKYTKNFQNKKMRFLFKWDDNFEKKKQNIMKDPDPSRYIEVYVPAYDYPQMVDLGGQKVLMKVSCEYPDYKTLLYYQKSALVAIYDFEQGTLTKLLGRYSPCYQNDLIAPAFSNHYFTPYKNGHYLLSFGLDSLIYICNNAFVPQKAFGIKGNLINEDYYKINAKNNETFSWKLLPDERATKGFYTSIYYCKEKDLTFRVYKTGIKEDNIPDDLTEETNPSRMQIYKGTDLIGDVPVPDKFEIIGYKAPWFFVDGYFKIEEDYDIIGFYKFKID